MHIRNQSGPFTYHSGTQLVAATDLALSPFDNTRHPAISVSIYEHYRLFHGILTNNPNVNEEIYQKPLKNLDAQYTPDPLPLVLR